MEIDSAELVELLDQFKSFLICKDLEKERKSELLREFIELNNDKNVVEIFEQIQSQLLSLAQLKFEDKISINTSYSLLNYFATSLNLLKEEQEIWLQKNFVKNGIFKAIQLPVIITNRDFKILFSNIPFRQIPFKEGDSLQGYLNNPELVSNGHIYLKHPNADKVIGFRVIVQDKTCVFIQDTENFDQKRNRSSEFIDQLSTLLGSKQELLLEVENGVVYQLEKPADLDVKIINKDLNPEAEFSEQELKLAKKKNDKINWILHTLFELKSALTDSSFWKN